jgi:hypothetical protein
MDQRQRIINNITNIIDDSGNKIQLADGGIRIEFKDNKYSAKKLAVWNIYVNGNRISKSDNYIFEYNCVYCYSRQLLSPITLIRKVNKCAMTCIECMRQSYPVLHQKQLTYVEKRDMAVMRFDALDDDYKSAYFQKHLTLSDYVRISKNIIGFQNGKIIDFENIEYWPIYNSTTQLSFTHIMYNTKTQTVFKPHQPIMECDNCNKHWRADTLQKFKNQYRIYCPKCCNNTCNTTIRYHNSRNINNSQILYCSLQERKFIDWCNNNGILVNNGPIISYDLAGKEKTYRIGFLLGNTLIDTKNNIWQRDEQPSANWQSKELAARALVADRKYDDYIIITPKTWITNLKYLKNKFAPSSSAANKPEKQTD